ATAYATDGHGEQIKPAEPPVDGTVPAGKAEPELRQSEKQCQSRACEVWQENQPTLPQMFSVPQRVVAQELYDRAAQEPGDQDREHGQRDRERPVAQLARGRQRDILAFPEVSGAQHDLLANLRTLLDQREPRGCG